VGTVLLAEALRDGWLVALPLVRQQADDKLRANRHADVAVLWIPELAQQSTAVAIAPVDPDRKPNDRKVCRSLRAAEPKDDCSSASRLSGRCSTAAGAAGTVWNGGLVAGIPRRCTRLTPGGNRRHARSGQTQPINEASREKCDHNHCQQRERTTSASESHTSVPRV
jgi:hypothetical protein